MVQADAVKKKDEELKEKEAYISKLEWRLLCQHKALEGPKERPPLAPKLGREAAAPTIPSLPASFTATPALPAAGEITARVWQLQSCLHMCISKRSKQRKRSVDKRD